MNTQKITELLIAAQNSPEAAAIGAAMIQQDIQALFRSLDKSGVEPHRFLEWMNASWTVGFNPMPHYRETAEPPVGLHWTAIRRAAWAFCETNTPE